MKNRNGFVSNSSSTSFVVAIDISKSKPCPHCHCKPPDFLALTKNQSESLEFFKKNITDYINQLKAQKDVLDEYNKIFQNALEDPEKAKLIIMAVKLGKSLYHLQRYPIGTETEAQKTEHMWSSASNLGYYSNDTTINDVLIQRLKDEQYTLKNHIEKLTNLMANKQTILDKLDELDEVDEVEELGCAEWVIIQTKVDNMDHNQEDLINDLVNKEIAVIINQEYKS